MSCLNRATVREQQSQRLQELLRAVVPANRFWTARLQAGGLPMQSLLQDAISVPESPAFLANAATGVQSMLQDEIGVPRDLCKLPLTRKQELVADHEAHSPYGSNLTFDVTAYSRLCQTSGTTGRALRWLDTPQSWEWMLRCWEQSFELAGLRTDDRLAFPFSFGPFLGFWAAFEGAARLGRLCLPGGGMSSEARLKLIDENQATVVCCTPTYALRLAEVAEQHGIDLKSGSVRMLIVAGEPGGSVPSIRQRIETAWGARVIDHWGMTEIGPLATECVENPGGLHVLETECIAEVIDPVTLQPFDLDAGNSPIRGELVITNLGRIGSPVIRYRTGDVVEVDPAPCPCGRSWLRLRGGILGRVDDMITIRGNNVFPTAVEAILREFPEIVEYRLEVVSRKAMQELKIEIETSFGTTAANAPLIERLAATIHERLHFRPEVVAIEPGQLPRFEMKGRRFHRRDESLPRERT